MLGSNQRPFPTFQVIYSGCCTVAAHLVFRRPNGPADTAEVASLAEECGPVPPRTQAIQETGPDQVLQRGPPNRRPAVKIGDARERSFVPLAEDCGERRPRDPFTLKWLKSSFPTSGE